MHMLIRIQEEIRQETRKEMLEEIYSKRDPRRHVGQERVGDTMDCCLTWLCNLSGSSCRIAQMVNGYAAPCSLHCFGEIVGKLSYPRVSVTFSPKRM